MTQLEAIRDEVHVRHFYLGIPVPNTLTLQAVKLNQQIANLCPQTVAAEGTVITVVNKSKKIKDDEVKKAMAQVQRQVSNEFGYRWGTGAQLVFAKAPSGHTCYVMDKLPHPGAGAGYHTPEGNMYVGTDYKPWTVGLSHEILEFLADPTAQCGGKSENCAKVKYPDGKKNIPLMVLKEPCDPCPRSYYNKGGITVANFVFPEWFTTPGKGGSGSVDFNGILSGPMTFAKDGFISAYGHNGRWEKLTASGFQAEAAIATIRDGNNVYRRLAGVLPY